MSLLLKMACRVIERRIVDGETWETIIADYPKMTDEEKQEIKTELAQ